MRAPELREEAATWAQAPVEGPVARAAVAAVLSSEARERVEAEAPVRAAAARAWVPVEVGPVEVRRQVEGALVAEWVPVELGRATARVKA